MYPNGTRVITERILSVTEHVSPRYVAKSTVFLLCRPHIQPLSVYGVFESKEVAEEWRKNLQGDWHVVECALIGYNEEL